MTGNFEEFHCSNFKVFEKQKAFLKNWSTVSSLKVIPWKTPHLLQNCPNVKSNRMASTKLAYHKERVSPITTLFLKKIYIGIS